MRYVQINSVPNGSTGSVMRSIRDEREAMGDECWCIWGRGREAENDHEFNFGTKTNFYLDVLQTRIDGRAGFHSKAATRRLLVKLDEIDPDVVHLHNLHGYYVNIEMLFEWLAAHRCEVKWTLHDCWAFTGHCAYFTFAKCGQWQSHCACDEHCPQLATYPKTFSKSSCSWNFEQKKRLFNIVPADRMTLVTPSRWLADLVGQSFLSKYPVEVRHNTVDTDVFKPTPSDFRERYGLEGKFIILGVASPWTERKGLGDFLRLAQNLDGDRFVIVLVGLDRRQSVSLPEESSVHIISIGKTKSQKELAEIYTAADVFFNPTKEDNFPTVNLEAQACGTPVLVYGVGGCEETLSVRDSKIVWNVEDAIRSLAKWNGGR